MVSVGRDPSNTKPPLWPPPSLPTATTQEAGINTLLSFPARAGEFIKLSCPEWILRICLVHLSPLQLTPKIWWGLELGVSGSTSPWALLAIPCPIPCLATNPSALPGSLSPEPPRAPPRLCSSHTVQPECSQGFASWWCLWSGCGHIFLGYPRKGQATSTRPRQTEVQL